MTKYFLLPAIFICVSCAHKQFVPFDNNTYIVKSISCDDNVCFIEVQRTDSIFVVVSLVDSVNFGLIPIEVGKRYHLDLIKIYPNEAFRNNFDEAEKQNVSTRLFGANERTHNSLYVATNLNGLSPSDNQLSIEDIRNRFSYVGFMPYHAYEKKRFLWVLSRRKKANPLSGVLYIKETSSTTKLPIE